MSSKKGGPDMFSRTDLDRIVDTMERCGVTSLTVEGDGIALSLCRPASAAAPAEEAPLSAPATTVKSPAIGTYLPRGAQDGLAPIATGHAVKAGDVLGYICQGAARIPVSAPIDGVLSGQWPETGGVIGYGDGLIALEGK